MPAEMTNNELKKIRNRDDASAQLEFAVMERVKEHSFYPKPQEIVNHFTPRRSAHARRVMTMMPSLCFFWKTSNARTTPNQLVGRDRRARRRKCRTFKDARPTQSVTLCPASAADLGAVSASRGISEWELVWLSVWDSHLPWE
jgi:hypothetical protein